MSAAGATPPVGARDTRAAESPRLWRVLARLIAAHPWLYVVWLVMHVSYFCVDLGTPLFTRRLLDALAGGAQLTLDLWTLVALIVASRLGRAVTGIILVVQQQVFNLVCGARLRTNLLERVVRHPAVRALPGSPGEAVSRFRDDVDAVISYVSFVNVNLAYAAVTFTGIYLMLRTDARITLLVFVPLAGVTALSNLLKGRTERYRRESREAAGRLSGALGEMFGAAQAVQLATAERRVIDHFDSLGEARRRRMVRDSTFNAIQDAVFGNASKLGTGVILLLVGQSMRAGTFTVGDFALFVYFLGWIGEFTSFIGTSVAQYRQSGVSLARIAALLTPPDTATAAHDELGAAVVAGKTAERALAAQPATDVRRAHPLLPFVAKTAADRLERVEVVGLAYRYPKTDRGIHGVSFTLRRGTFTVVTGRIGSGKTTLLRVLLGLLPRDTGSVAWNGVPVEDAAAHFVPPRVAYTPQVPRLFSDTLRDNVLLGLPEQRVRLEEAARLAVLTPDLAALEKGWDTVVGPRGVKLSGGQIQRAAAARMLVREPELLVVDDLSSALDVETERALWEGLSAQGQVTCLVASHRHRALCRADQIVVLREGRVEATGTLEELLLGCEEMRRVWSGDGMASDPTVSSSRSLH